MLNRFERFIAFRYLRSKRKEVFISIITIISILGVAVSVAVLDVTLAIMTGFEREFREKLIGSNAHILVRQFGSQMSGWPELQAKIEEIPEVLSVFPYSYNQAMLSTDAGAQGVILYGVADNPAAKEKIKEFLEPKDTVDFLFSPPKTEIQRPDGTLDQIELPPLLVGRELVRRLGLRPGEPVTVFSPRMSSSPQGLIPKQRRFLVVGIYHFGFIEYEGGIAYTSLSAAQSFFGLGEAVTGLEVRVRNMDRAKDVALVIREKIGGAESPYYVTDWTEQNKALWQAMKLEKRVYFIVLLLVIFIASFSIVSTLVMMVMEKGKDIAILKSMGAPDGSILRIFLMQGSIIGFLGMLLGSIIGVLGCLGLREFGFPLDERVFGISEVPIYMSLENFIIVAFAAFLITTLAGVYPAIRAARLNPAEALRYE